LFKDYRIGTAVLVGALLLSLVAANYGWFVTAEPPAGASAEASVRTGSSGARTHRFFGGGYGGGFRGGK
jgi:hypothetical protein